MTIQQAEQLLREGRPEEALVSIQAEIKSRPAEARLRVFLFQLLTVLGRWDRALNQLNVCAELDAGNLLMASAYRELIQCESLRGEVFAGRHTPLLFGDPERWMAELLEALRLDGQGHANEAAALRSRAFEKAPASAGTVDTVPFAWIADADNRLGPMLEVILNGRYYWIPFSRIRRIQTAAPGDLRDLVWLPAEFTWVNEGEAFGFIPVRYPGSENRDGDTQLARRTDWEELSEGLYKGLGQRMWATDAGEYPLLGCRQIMLVVPGVGDG